MKRVLIPTDFSANAWNAICFGLQMFKEEECEFFLLNTYTPVIPSSRFAATVMNGARIEETVKCNSEVGLQTTLERINNIFSNPKHSFKIISSFNLLVDEVLDVVDQFSMDLIITGTKGASGMEEVFMGSNTVRIIKAVKGCPVLAIPQNFEFVRPQEIAFATDFNRFYAESELEPLVNLAKTFGSSIRIVHVQQEIAPLTELQQFNLSMLRKYLSGVDHFVHTISELNNISHTLRVFSHELDVHLLAMLNYQHSYLERMTREPVVKRTAFHTSIPLLVIPELGIGNKKFKREEKLQEQVQ